MSAAAITHLLDLDDQLEIMRFARWARRKHGACPGKMTGGLNAAGMGIAFVDHDGCCNDDGLNLRDPAPSIGDLYDEWKREVTA